MTGNDNAQPILAIRVANSTVRLGVADLTGNVLIGACLGVANRTQRCPHLLLKFCPLHPIGNSKDLPLPLKIFIKLDRA
ncbi:hypothetical protein D1872_342380 [compost metagenome]